MRKTTKNGIDDLKSAKDNFLRTLFGEIKKPFVWLGEKLKAFIAWLDI